MGNCVICETKLGFLNRPTFGQGKLTDGNEICYNCFIKYGSSSTNFKKMSSETVKEFIASKDVINDDNNNRLIEIKSQIQNLKLDNISNFLARKEINELPKILADNEFIDHIVQGTYNGGQGILVSTNRRLIFIDKGFLYGLKVEDFPLDKISSIQYETGLLLGNIKIHTSGNFAKIENIEKVSARIFSEFVRNKLSQPKESTSQILQPNILDQLEKLAKLKENGIISEEEFNENKKKLLEKL
jgi:hypothetical protein